MAWPAFVTARDQQLLFHVCDHAVAAPSYLPSVVGDTNDGYDGAVTCDMYFQRITLQRMERQQICLHRTKDQGPRNQVSHSFQGFKLFPCGWSPVMYCTYLGKS